MSVPGGILPFMAQITDLDVRMLKFAEKRERGDQLGGVVKEFGISPTRYTQILMHLVQRPEVVADPRWTMMANRIQRVMAANKLVRASRAFRQRSA
jgi:hypothetical protein